MQQHRANHVQLTRIKPGPAAKSACGSHAGRTMPSEDKVVIERYGLCYGLCPATAEASACKPLIPRDTLAYLPC